MLKIKLFVKLNEWKGINFLSGVKKWEKFERTTVVVFNFLFIESSDKKEINKVDASKHNSKREDKPIFSIT